MALKTEKAVGILHKKFPALFGADVAEESDE
jgi:hypothetical protein